ncbi:YibE/F family protein [Corynebacterium amycolatum]|uniref:YibE/F family protein n=1 Tax=Corynebacterium amycolatum TaxID=43765 RepID=UPI003839699D
MLATVLTVAGIATFLAVIGLWPSGEAPSPGPGFLQSQTSAAETVKGTVVKHSVGACNSPDNGRVFDDQPRPGLAASLNDPAAPKCQLSVIELTSGPDEGKKTLLEASGLPGEIELEEGDKVVLAIHRPNAAGTGAVDNGAVPDPGLMTPAPGVVPAPAPEGAEGEPAPDAEAPAPAPAPEQEPAPESDAEVPAAPAAPEAPAPATDTNVVDLAPDQVVDTASIGNTYTFLDMDRTTTIWLWLGAAVLLIILVGMTRGVLSLIGLGITLAAVMGFLVPALLRGGDSVALAITAGAAILFPVLFLVHGINWKSASALAGTLTTMVLAAGLANLAISTSQLRGLGNEDNLLIQLYLPDVSVTGLLLAGFIIGALGVLNDVTIAQASTVQELYEAAPRSRPMEVFRSAMRVGRDHIASMVYTLVLAYLGTALPLSILLSVSDRPLMQSLTSDVVATELLRSTIGAVALVLAVPITTLIAAYTVAPEGMKFPKRSRAASI